jgi:hypothetical protein
MRFEVPFLPDDAYVRLLNRHAGRIDSIHYGLPVETVQDARVRLHHASLEASIGALQQVAVRDRYLLMNSRFHLQAGYLDPGRLGRTVDTLQVLLAAGVIRGIVFSDAYFLAALSHFSPETARALEAVPSINFMIDDFDKLQEVLGFVTGTCFRFPRKLIVDRSLNRRPEKLARLVEKSRRYPELKIGLLANEGCLYQCPFKLTHDALISLANQAAGVDTFRLNRDLGCMQALSEKPWRLFRSPFIRPEDSGLYEGRVDFIKLCGRTLGPDFLGRALQAYVGGRYQGNLLDLLDSMHWMAGVRCVENDRLPTDYLEVLSTCGGQCTACGYCPELLEKYSRPLTPHIPPLAGQQP